MMMFVTQIVGRQREKVSSAFLKTFDPVQEVRNAQKIILTSKYFACSFFLSSFLSKFFFLSHSIFSSDILNSSFLKREE